jgi:cyclic beta-1,2-glucan synthetase
MVKDIPYLRISIMESKSIQTMFVPMQDPIKIVRVSLENKTDQPRNLSLFFYAEWVLGVNRGENARFIITDYMLKTIVCWHIIAIMKNLLAEQLSCPVICLFIPILPLRSEFLGRNGSMDFPQAMKAKCFSNRAGVYGMILAPQYRYN